jgi:hypothetical protein
MRLALAEMPSVSCFERLNSVSCDWFSTAKADIYKHKKIPLPSQWDFLYKPGLINS